MKLPLCEINQEGWLDEDAVDPKHPLLQPEFVHNDRLLVDTSKERAEKKKAKRAKRRDGLGILGDEEVGDKDHEYEGVA